MKAYKGFDKNLKCRGYQFKEGKVHTEPEANCVQNGFHCAENPLDCLTYYPNWEQSVYYIVKAGGDIDEDGTDTKISCTELTLVKKLSKEDFIIESLEYIKKYPLREVFGTYVKDGSGDAGSIFVIARGKDPVAVGEIGSVIGFAREKSGSREIEFISCFTVDGNMFKPGVKYNSYGMPADEEQI